MNNKEIKVKCKRCGKLTNSKDFVLDPDYKMMVCPQCIKEKQMKKEVYSELAKEKEKKEGKVEAKPAGWDKEDEYLEKTQRARMKETVIVRKVGDSRVKYKCPKCNYQFLYDMEKKTPTVCPYCSSNIYKIRFE